MMMILMRDLNLNNAIGQLFSYGSSCFMVGVDATDMANWLLAALPALAGAYLTFRIAKVRKAEAERISMMAKAELEAKEIENRRKQLENKKLELQIQNGTL